MVLQLVLVLVRLSDKPNVRYLLDGGIQLGNLGRVDDRLFGEEVQRDGVVLDPSPYPFFVDDGALLGAGQERLTGQHDIGRVPYNHALGNVAQAFQGLDNVVVQCVCLSESGGLRGSLRCWPGPS